MTKKQKKVYNIIWTVISIIGVIAMVFFLVYPAFS